MLLSYCVVNTNGREFLPACLNAIRDTHSLGVEAELLVLDNASSDRSAELIAELCERDPWLARAVRLITLDRPEGKASNDNRLLQEARGELCLLLNEDTELQPGSVAALIEALEADPVAAAAGAQLLEPDGKPRPCAWRLPGIGTALRQALFLHKWLVTQSGGDRTRRVGWAQSAALLVRRDAAEQVGWLDPDFFVYSDETDFCKRLGDAGRATIYVPGAQAIHHEQLAGDRSSGEHRVIEFHRNRDRYMRKHHGSMAAALVRVLTAFSYLPRAVAALVLPAHDPRWYWLHARKALKPTGDGIRELVEAGEAQR